MPRQNLFAIALVGIVSALCWQTGQAAKPKDETMELYGVFVDAVEQVEANYVRPVNRKELLESALKGMLQNLDQHSSYFSESDWKQFKKQIEGSFTGIGVQIDIDPDTGRLKVLSPLVGSPAYEAGILAGDEILDVDGQSTDGINRDRAVEMLQGRPGTTVKLTVLHPGAEKTEAIAVKRAVIELPSVVGDSRKPDDSWDWMLDKEKKIGYVRVTSFIQNTTEDLKKALDELRTQDAKALILDLRDDPGGLLSSAVEVSDLFLQSGLIVTTKGRNTKDKVYEAEKSGTFPEIPIVVLVNQHSASAAEIVSAALQDHHRAVVVGQRSYGKGSVQNILPLDNGDSVLKLTVATYWRPSGKNIHRFKHAKEKDEWGVSPDPGMEVKLTTEESLALAEARRDRDLLSSHNRPKGDNEKHAKRLTLPADDKQLAKAIEVAKSKLAAAGDETAKK
jgi:carboxyl-terminal processing protease